MLGSKWGEGDLLNMLETEETFTVWARNSHSKVIVRIENSNDCGEECNQGAPFIVNEMKKCINKSEKRYHL